MDKSDEADKELDEILMYVVLGEGAIELSQHTQKRANEAKAQLLVWRDRAVRAALKKHSDRLLTLDELLNVASLEELRETYIEFASDLEWDAYKLGLTAEPKEEK